MTRYLQLRVRELRCVRETQNRQNFLGIPLETDPDSIDLSAIVIDAGEGQVAQAPPTFLGNRYRDGIRERFSPPKVIAEIPIADDDVFPRRVTVTLNMAEKDDGGGFDRLMTEVARELASELGNVIGDELGDDIAMSDLYAQAESVAGSIIAGIFTGIGDALGLGDDPFKPVNVSVTVNGPTDAPPTDPRTIHFYEPHPAHKGEFVLTYDWNVASQRALVDSSGSGASRGALGSSSAALSAPGAGYPRPYHSFQFRKPRKQTKAPVPLIKVHPKLPSWWFPTPIRLINAGQKR